MERLRWLFITNIIYQHSLKTFKITPSNTHASPKPVSQTSDKGRLTTSSPLPLNILSVVATTFPPLRCKSHMIFRLDTCGNICCIRSTSASRALRLFADEPFLFPLALELDEKKKYRIARPPRKSIRISCGMLIVWSEEDILCMRCWVVGACGGFRGSNWVKEV